MTVTERLMRPSSGTIQFTDDLPPRISEEIRALVDERNSGVGAHVVITASRIDPVAIGDAAALAAAVYTGKIDDRPTRTSIAFKGIDMWLDSYVESDITRVSGTPSQWISDLLINNITGGTVTNTGATNVSRTIEAYSTTRRQALDLIARLGGWEYRFQPDFTIDAATKANLFRSPPQVIVTRRSEGPDGTLRGVDGAMLDQGINTETTVTKAVALAGGQGRAIIKGSYTGSTTLRTPTGSAPTLVGVFSAPSEEAGNADAAAQSWYGQQGPRFEINVSSSTHDIPLYVVPGDEVWLWDQEAGIVDSTNQKQFRGETIFPALARCTELTWPIEQGYGVYIRPNSSSPTWIDVSSWVAWESGDARWTVGDWSPDNSGRANRTNPEIETRVSAPVLATANLSGVSAASGWSVTAATLRRVPAGGALLSIVAQIERTGSSIAPTGTNATVATFTHADATGNITSPQGLTILDVAGGALFRAGFAYTPSTGELSLMATSDTIPTNGIFYLSGVVAIAT